MIELNEHCTVSPITKDEIPQAINYFLESSPAYLKALGTDATKLPSFDEWHSRMLTELQKPLEEKKSFTLGWRYDGQLIGHSTIDQIDFGHQANIHIHIWKPSFFHKQLGSTFVCLSLQHFFKHFHLQKIFGQPKATNRGPNRIAKTLGFKLIKIYKTIPHPICFEQTVAQYVLDKETFEEFLRK